MAVVGIVYRELEPRYGVETIYGFPTDWYWAGWLGHVA